MDLWFLHCDAQDRAPRRGRTSGLLAASPFAVVVGHNQVDVIPAVIAPLLSPFLRKQESRWHHQRLPLSDEV